MNKNAITSAAILDAAAPVSATGSDLQFQTGGEGVQHHGKRELYRLILARKNFCKGGQFDGLC